MPEETHTLRVIARIRSDFPTKFGVPRQSGLVEALKSTVVFEPPYRNPDALRGLESFSHIWLIWQFSGAVRESWSPTVRPPRLGGNARMGVFATRSPFRPNPIGLSAVRLEGIDLHTPDGPVLRVAGADLMDGTPIYDIKPYLAYGDCIPEAGAGYTSSLPERLLEVDLPERWLALVPQDRREALLGVLAHDPRPSYQRDPERVYGLSFAGLDVRFTVTGDVLTVCQIRPLNRAEEP
ncbi:MAG TPA: tRNA (N6-threonylcarbamoyladenosine(37)-N6)-methyltransferase TrmO [Candidatus Flavonifractor intestinipullorum]|uniref:tRNA (N6-threonylcarbamoyladenosine(37)-N6)-methyltransferase TrmO n=1 Tax=Candidatus Flavonifractor intestinipullorum TaxID=2838587 RepID=A0A9D2S4R9_9FIRM|nr:tRNA (N6-threonylcarbamoyladenosine(37)-N6)-methyltransferase TrmO [Candidatus Flavonifractor intestinipullorum]